ncbi:MAG: gliding motility protein RemB, partial [Flavobacteriaceae bacterium]|nr:gliding motility protein RemB [Flavobacteriaceae bacterium]
MNKFILLISLFVVFNSYTQEDVSYEKWPVFPECENLEIEQYKSCFNQQLSQFIFENFEVPEIVEKDNYKGNVVVLFEVDAEGNFVVLYVDAIYDELKTKAKLVFAELPKIKPATYNGNPTYKQFSYEIKIPLDSPLENAINETKKNDVSELEKLAKEEFETINKELQKFEDEVFKSSLNIPFTHQYYSKFDRNINLVGTNMHTASKPFLYEDISSYYNFSEAKNSLVRETDSWWKRKLLNEHLVQIKGKDYWFTVDPIFDLQVGKDTDADFNSTFNNTRGIFIQGGLGKKLSFSASVYESQGRFAQYYNQYAESLGKPGSETEVAVIPGRGISKRFKDDAYDYPVAEGYLSFTPSKHFNIQFGHGKNFIGDGYRSLLQSDVASPSPFFKLSTKFWKIKYTNTWMWLKDIRTDAVSDKAFLTKYMANHYLSWNVSK